MSLRSLLRPAAPVALVAVAALSVGPATGAATPPTLQSATFGTHHHVLVDAAGHALYILTSEAGGKVHCVQACLDAWPGVMLPEGVSTITHTAAVRGSLGFIKRGKLRQATFNGYPLYLYAGDTKAHEAQGVGLTTGTGTWVLVNASATTAAATPVKPTATASTGTGGGW